MMMNSAIQSFLVLTVVPVRILSFIAGMTHNKNATSQELSTVLDSLSRLADLEQRIAGRGPLLDALCGYMQLVLLLSTLGVMLWCVVVWAMVRFTVPLCAVS